MNNYLKILINILIKQITFSTRLFVFLLFSTHHNRQKNYFAIFSSILDAQFVHICFFPILIPVSSWISSEQKIHKQSFSYFLIFISLPSLTITTGSCSLIPKTVLSSFANVILPNLSILLTIPILPIKNSPFNIFYYF